MRAALIKLTLCWILIYYCYWLSHWALKSCRNSKIVSQIIGNRRPFLKSKTHMLDLFSTMWSFLWVLVIFLMFFSGGFAIVWLSWSYFYPLFVTIVHALRDLFCSRIQSTQKAIHSPVSVPMMLSTSGRAPLNTIHSSGNAIRTLLNAFLVYTLRKDYTFFRDSLRQKKKTSKQFYLNTGSFGCMETIYR